MEYSNLFKINKKTIYRVIIFHFLVILLLVIPFKSFKKEKNHLIVNDIIVINEPKPKVLHPPKHQIQKENPKPINPPLSLLKKPSPILKKTTQNITQKNELINNDLLQKLEKQIKTLDTPKDKITLKKELVVPKKIKAINIDKKIAEINKSNVNNSFNFKELLIKELQSNLKLPEYGEVKVSFIIHPNGKITDISILDYKSEINQNYLKNSLSEILFKNMDKLFQEKQKLIVIFKNE